MNLYRFSEEKSLKSILCVLQLCGMTKEMANTYIIGKGKLYDVQNAEVPIIVAHDFVQNYLLL